MEQVNLETVGAILDGAEGPKAKIILKKLLQHKKTYVKMNASPTLSRLVSTGLVSYQWVTEGRAFTGYRLHPEYAKTVERLVTNFMEEYAPADVARTYAAFLRWEQDPLGESRRRVLDYTQIITACAGKGKLKPKHISRLLGWGRHMNRTIDNALSEFSKTTGLAVKDSRGYWKVANSNMFKAVMDARKKAQQRA